MTARLISWLEEHLVIVASTISVSLADWHAAR